MYLFDEKSAILDSISRHTMAKFYKLDINRTEWEIPDTYQQLQSVGSGAYGQVCKGIIENIPINSI